MTSNETKLAYKISVKGMLVNLGLFAIKGIAGLMINSVSLLSDAVHSLTDIVSTLVVLVGIKISSKPADKEHPYGHDRIECFIALLLGLMLFFIGGIIGYEGYQKIVTPPTLVENSMLMTVAALLAAIISILGKEWMYRFTMKCAKEIGSASMAADAWHHRSDAISSVGSSIGVIGIMFGLPIIDVICCFLIMIFIFKAAFDICKDAIKRLIDSSGDPKTIDELKEIINANADVISIDDIKTRQFGSKLYVDLEVSLDKHMTFEHSHEISHSLESTIESSIPEIKHIMIHVNPS